MAEMDRADTGSGRFKLHCRIGETSNIHNRAHVLRTLTLASILCIDSEVETWDIKLLAEGKRASINNLSSIIATIRNFVLKRISFKPLNQR